MGALLDFLKSLPLGISISLFELSREAECLVTPESFAEKQATV